MKLTVVIADISPLVFANEPVKHRSVRIELTEEQTKKLALAETGGDGKKHVYENVAMCFLED